MARPLKCRCIDCSPGALYFEPRDVPPARPRDAEIRLRLDELEAVRLADGEGRYHADAAARMKVSRATFGRILDRARAKIAEALVCGRPLRIEIRPAEGGRGSGSE